MKTASSNILTIEVILLSIFKLYSGKTYRP